jgi:HTH-type transcriptional repressor of NAD biosynthesis genes
MPPHLGHSFLIDRSSEHCEHLVVFVNTRRTEPIPGILRAQWLADLHPTAEVVQVAHDLETNFDDHDLWERWIQLFSTHWPLDEGPHALFSSELYGGELAHRLGAEHVPVDPDRSHVRISATEIRQDPLSHLDLLAPEVAAWVEQWARHR